MCLTAGFSLWAKEQIIEEKISLLCRELIDGIHFENPVKIALIDIEIVDSRSRGVADEIGKLISKSLGANSNYEIVNSELINKLSNDLNLGYNSFFDPGNIMDIGNLANADYLLIGSFSSLASVYLINLRLVSVESGTLIKAVSAEIEKRVLDQVINSIFLSIRVGISILFEYMPTYINEYITESEIATGNYYGRKFDIMGLSGSFYFDFFYVLCIEIVPGALINR
ncbi:hypothetical protein ES708_11165 [subsurface metagenome]